VVAAEIAERKRAEEALRRANAELRRPSADLIAFAFAVSHDLQEPLRTIACCAQLLIGSLTGALNGESAIYTDFIILETKRMRELISDLLAYTQILATDQEELELLEPDLAGWRRYLVLANRRPHRLLRQCVFAPEIP